MHHVTSVELGLIIFVFIDEDKINTKADRQLESLENSQSYCHGRL